MPSADTNPRMDADAEISTSTWVLFVVLVYIALISISGGTVYAIYGWRGDGSGPNGTITSAIKGMVQTASKQLTAVPNTTACPLLVANCPNITCKELACVPSSVTPSCFTTPAPRREPCMEALPCPNGTCRARTCPTRRPAPPIGVFYNSGRDTKTVSEWLNMYPPFSKSRLIVVTTLLEESIEPWALAGFIHRCKDSATYPLLETTCTFCQDRYNYIQCIMSNNLIQEPHRYAAVDKSYFGEPEFLRMRGWLPDIILNDPHWRPEELDNIFLHIERAFRSFTIKTDVAGRSCKICDDFNRRIYDECFSTDGVRYSFPFVQNETAKL